MQSVVIRMAFYCIVFQGFGCRGWPSSGNTNLQIIIHEVVYCVHSSCLETLLCLHLLEVWLLGGISFLCL